VEKPKPAPDGVLQAMRVLEAGPGETVVVGDAGADVLAGKQAGATAVLARWARLAPPFDLPSSPDRVFTAVSGLEHFLYME
jgi:AHBA synthesis associated protein